MQWTDEAEAAIKKVPFFVRRKVRTRVEREASDAGKATVSLSDVKATQARYLKKMSNEVKGYQLDACFGSSGCPHRAMASEVLVEKDRTGHGGCRPARVFEVTRSGAI
jgi:anaerobic sulfite reductase subunit C